jgi:MFS family permease
VALIVVAETLGTSLWFCGKAVQDEVATLWSLDLHGQAALLTVVQIGFIVGTLVLATTGFADGFAASRVFAVSAVFGAAANLAFAWFSRGLADALVWRICTGLALAGIYPLGMKLVVTWMPQRAGEVLGWLVGAVALGTSMPYLLRALGGIGHWQMVASIASVFALTAAVLVLILGDGPAARPPARRFDPRLAIRSFQIPDFRSSAFGYFGHMWELYAFWAMVPTLVGWIIPDRYEAAWWIFLVIAVGAVGNVAGGVISRRCGSAAVAVTALAASGLICVMAPALPQLPVALSFGLLMLWGLSAPADSPQFSALSARAVPPEAVGSALALQNAIGFTITVVSVQLTAGLEPLLGQWISWFWVPGPLLGILAMRRMLRKKVEPPRRQE